MPCLFLNFYMETKKILLVGCGPHAERAYIPTLLELENLGRIKLTCVLETKSKLSATKDMVVSQGFSADVVNVNSVKDGELTHNLQTQLDELHGKHNFDGIIIATEPTQHRQYILWALENKIHILVDKPLTTYDNVSNDIELAKRINDDFRLFLTNYNDRSKAFIVNAQRRYHKGFQLVIQKISEIAKRFQMPITSIQSMHSDGQWRFPDEITSLNYHPYNTGYGKVSHSGYHIIDILNEFVKAGNIPGKIADEYEYYTKFIRPDGIIKQMPLNEYSGFFPQEKAALQHKLSSAKIQDFSKYGEVDASSIITAKLHGVPIAQYTINLMHNTFSRRAWVQPSKDLYKSNGRVKHEYHNIVQGPIQTIQIHSYQSNDKHSVNTKEDYLFGGNNHFDISIFRNNILTGENEPLQQISIDNLDTYDSSRLITELTKKTVMYEFVDIMYNIKKPEDSYSFFPTHADSARMMSMIYQSAHQSGSNISTYKYES